MATDQEHAKASAEANNGQAEGSRWRKVGSAGLSFLNPLSDVGVFYRRALRPTGARLKLLWELRKGSPAAREALTWEQAVQRSGCSVSQLRKRFSGQRKAWWLLMVGAGTLAGLLMLLLLAANTSLPGGALLRAGFTLTFLIGGAALGFLKALIATYRLWQLETRRVSLEEHGTFQDFQAETRWVHQTLVLGHFD